MERSIAYIFGLAGSDGYFHTGFMQQPGILIGTLVIVIIPGGRVQRRNETWNAGIRNFTGHAPAFFHALENEIHPLLFFNPLKRTQNLFLLIHRNDDRNLPGHHFPHGFHFRRFVRTFFAIRIFIIGFHHLIVEAGLVQVVVDALDVFLVFFFYRFLTPVVPPAAASRRG